MIKNKDYEDLIRWTMNDIRDLPNDIKKLASKQFDNYVMATVMNLDIKCVINNTEEFIQFKNDLMNRISV